MPMLTFDSLPQARLVRKGGQLFAPPPAPRVQPEPSALRDGLYSILHVVVGLWPLTAICLLAMGFLIMAANNGAP